MVKSQNRREQHGHHTNENKGSRLKKVKYWKYQNIEKVWVALPIAQLTRQKTSNIFKRISPYNYR
jgi:hypothetical protein